MGKSLSMEWKQVKGPIRPRGKRTLFASIDAKEENLRQRVGIIKTKIGTIMKRVLDAC
jgi:hypothetical protein